MARPARIHIEGGWYHVTIRGTDRKRIFTEEQTYQHFLELLEEFSERFRVGLHAYALMLNHVHLVLQTPEANLSGAMQWLSTSYAMWFNRRDRRVGPLFQGRYKAVLFEGRTEAWPITRYLHLNPVRVAGLELGKQQRAAEAQGLIAIDRDMLARRRQTLKEYAWSSYPCYAGWKPTPRWLDVQTVLAGSRPLEVKAQRLAYRRYVESMLGQNLPESPLAQAAAGLLCGSQAWVERMRRLLKGERREQKALRDLEHRPDWASVRSAVETIKGERWEQFRNRHGDSGRDMALYVARRTGGMSLADIGKAAGIDNYYAVAQAILRFDRRLRHDRQLHNDLAAVGKCMNVKT